MSTRVRFNESHREPRLTSPNTFWKRLLGHCCLVALLGCSLACKVELYSNLEEREANEMLAELIQHGLDGDKVAAKDELWTIRIEKAELAPAVKLLKSLGFPREQFTKIGQVFQKEGLISSPLEERVRFIYALSQELADTISQIDGVLSARVHVVLPENNPLGKTLKPASASVFIKYRHDSEIPARIPQIKQLVVNGIEGLTYEKVTVALFSGESVAVEQAPNRESLLGFKVGVGSAKPLGLILIIPVILLGLLLGSVAFYYLRHVRPTSLEAAHD